MADNSASQIASIVKPYAGWAALAFFVAALFSSIVAKNFAVPLLLYAFALCLAMFRYWEQLKVFDFWALDEWLRTRLDAWEVREWQSLTQAAEAFCNQVAVKSRNEAAAEMNVIMMEIIRQNNAPDAEQHDFSAMHDPNAERNARYEAAQIRFSQCNTALSRELHTYLARGDLLAKGLPTEGDFARAERIIPTSRWRVMTLDIAKAQAAGMGWQYMGILVGVKPRKPKRKMPPVAQQPQAPQQPKGPQPQRPMPPRPPRRSA